jgi:hypothetical protein
MNDRWHTLLRVRDLRAQLAHSELSQRRHIETQAWLDLEHARRQHAQLEERALKMSALLAARALDNGTFNAAEAQELLRYATGNRLKAQQAATPVRRAQLQFDRAREATEAAGARFRQEARRRAAVESRREAAARSDLRRRTEVDEELRAEERASAERASALDANL